MLFVLYIIEKLNNNMKENNIIIPIVSYSNAGKYKHIIYKDNKNKSGIYRWNNLVTGKSYVGSAKSLNNRFSIYYFNKCLKYRLNQGSSIIYRALLKYGHLDFSLDILEYCDETSLVKREQYYIDLLKPEYNICKKAGSRLGYKHSEATKIKMSISQSGDKHPFFGKRHSLETRIKIGNNLKFAVRPNNKPLSLETKIKLSLKSKGVPVEIFDNKNNFIKRFTTMTSVANHFNISIRTVGRYLDKNTSYNGFVFKTCRSE